MASRPRGADRDHRGAPWYRDIAHRQPARTASSEAQHQDSKGMVAVLRHRTREGTDDDQSVRTNSDEVNIDQADRREPVPREVLVLREQETDHRGACNGDSSAALEPVCGTMLEEHPRQLV